MKELLELGLKRYEYRQVENSRTLSCTGCGHWDAGFEYKELVGWIPPRRQGKTLGVFECLKCGTKFSYHIGETTGDIVQEARIAIEERKYAKEKK